MPNIILALFLVFMMSMHDLCQGNLVPPPSLGLASNMNYQFINSNGGNILELTVAIDVDVTLMTSESGVGFQLNCYSPLNGTNSVIVWQQFIIQTHPEYGTYSGSICTWSASGNVICPGSTMANFQGDPHVIPAGTRFTIHLYNGIDGIVLGAVFRISNGVEQQTMNMLMTNYTGIDNAPVTEQDMAPITAFEVNIVGGQGNGNFSQGSGLITYSAPNSLLPLGQQPAGLQNIITGETGNTIYSEMQNVTGTTLVQYWVTQGSA